ncbi:MAG: uroporphyrinogen decarboxylase family protein [Anaerolineae bacterium]
MSSAEWLSPRERVLTSLSWREPDRVPIQVYLTPEVEAMLQEHFGGKPAPAESGVRPVSVATLQTHFDSENLLRHLGVDLRSVAPKWRGPLKDAHDGITYDIWGAGYHRVEYGAGAYEEAVELPLADLKTLDDVERYPWPDPDDFDYSVIADQCRQYDDYAIMLGDAGTPDILNGVSRGRGMSQVVMDVALRDPVGMAIIDHRVDFFYEVVKRGLEAGDGRIDMLQLGEDTGNQNGRMFSPRDFAEVFRPRLQKFYELAHQYGAKAMMHSCGDTHDIMPTFIDMGLDVLDAMQPEPRGMNPEAIRAICKGKLAFCGLISTQDTLPFGTVADCRREARHRLDVIARGGGYIFAPAHCIQPGTPLENILAVYEEALGHSLQ